jgi:hypothetical protein
VQNKFDWQPISSLPNDRLILLWIWPADVIGGVKPRANVDGSTSYITRRGFEMTPERCRGWIDPKDFVETPEAKDFSL